MIDNGAYAELEALLGSENISEDPSICDTYAAQPFHRTEPGIWIHRPAAVVLPSSTEEVSGVVKICNKYKIKYIAHSTGFGAHSGPGEDGVIQVDLRRMNKVHEIDVNNMYAVVEPYTTYMQVQAETYKHNLTPMVITSGPHCSILASITSHQGGGGSSCSMGYNGRNLLACEWVSPTGEIIKIGSAGSDAGWMSADGPGPSMKGIVRGYFGYDGGFGIFTKATVKLHDWAGPSELDIKGHLMDIEVDVPKNFRSYTMFMPNWDALSDCMYKMGECEAAYYMNKQAAAVSLAILLPKAGKEAFQHDTIRSLVGAGQHMIGIVTQGHSQAELNYKEKCLKAICDDFGGFMIGGHPQTQMEKAMFVATIKASMYLLSFSGPGAFHVAMGADESIDAICEQGKAAEIIKLKYIEDNAATDDMGDGAWACLYEHGTWGHCEATMTFDPTNPLHAPTMQKYSDDCADVQFDKHLGGIGFGMFGGLKTVEKFSEGSYNFFDWTKRVKKIWDPDNLSNMTFR